MILNGKAKEDFNKWNYENDFGYIDCEPTSLVVHFENLDENLKSTIITEWFDSVGIYISTPPYFDKKAKYNRGFECYVSSDNSNIVFDIDNDGDVFESRNKAKIKAIIKANEIYNEKNQ